MDAVSFVFFLGYYSLNFAVFKFPFYFLNYMFSLGFFVIVVVCCLLALNSCLPVHIFKRGNRVADFENFVHVGKSCWLASFILGL